jgi:Lrp/AsnC family transcriptional regulator for asnA, asnC and gidA
MTDHHFVLNWLQKNNILVSKNRLISELALSDRPTIDEVDVRILQTLLKNVRTSFSEIAKDCGMSSNAIRIRFNRLEQNGIITGSLMQVNPKRLGYDCIALLMIKAEANMENEVYGFVRKIPGVVACFQPIGRYNIHCFVALKNVDELAHTIERVSSHPNVMVIKEGIWVDVVKMDHPENLAIKPSDELLHPSELLAENNKPKPAITPSQLDEVEETDLEESYELDKTDLLIVKILSKKASMSFRKIAKKLGISTQSVIKRYNRMRKSVLPFSSITVDLRKLGYIGLAVFLVNTSHKHTTSKVFDEIVQIPNVIVAHKCVGAIDINLVAPFLNFKQVLEVKQKICNTPGVKELEIFLEEPFPSWPLNLFAPLLPKS